MTRVYHIGDRVQLTDYSGREIIDRMIRIEKSILELDCTSKIYLSKDTTTPHLLDSFKEFQGVGIRVINDNSKLVLLVGEAR